MMAPKLEAMTEEFPNVVFLKVDADEAEVRISSPNCVCPFWGNIEDITFLTQDAAEKYEVSALPTFMLFKNEQSVTEPIVGGREDKLRDAVKQHAS